MDAFVQYDLGLLVTILDYLLSIGFMQKLLGLLFFHDLILNFFIVLSFISVI